MSATSLRYFWVKNEEGKLEFAFCGAFKARVGVFVLSCQGMTLMLITTLINLYSENTEKLKIQALQYFLLFFYLIIMYAGFIIAFLGAFWERSKHVKIGAFLVGFGMVIYIVFVIVSMVPNYTTMRVVCPGRRCPDHHWLYHDRWRSIFIRLEVDLYHQINSRLHEYSIPIGFKHFKLNLSNTQEQKLATDFVQYNLSRTLSSSKIHSLIKTPVLNENNFKLKRIIQNNSTEKQNFVQLDTKKLAEEPTYDDYEYIEGEKQVLFVIVSVFYVLIYLGYLLYVILTCLSFAKQLTENN